jgi:hypothetical protein
MDSRDFSYSTRTSILLEEAVPVRKQGAMNPFCFNGPMRTDSVPKFGVSLRMKNNCESKYTGSKNKKGRAASVIGALP